MPFASTLGAVGRIGTRLRAAMHRAHRATIDHRPRPIDLILPSQPIEQRKVDQIPKYRPAANRASGANRSFPSRSPVPAATSAKESRFAARTRYR
jgi:hypothetical protein